MPLAPRSTFSYHHLIEVPLLPAQMPFVRFWATQKIKISKTLLNGVFQTHSVEYKTYAVVGVLRIVATIV